MIKITKKLYVTGRDEWRRWLSKNHDSANEIWLVYYKKHTGKSRIPYDDAVEEALCFGWIDSIVKRIDEEKYCQKYSPRKDRSIWSEVNKKRARKMIRQKRMTRAGLAKVNAAKKNGEWQKTISNRSAETAPPELKKALARNKKAKENFENYPPSLQKRFIWWILLAKREETRAKRIKETVKMAAQNKKPGMM